MNNQIYRKINIGGIKGNRPVNALIDTGANYSIISPELADTIGVIGTREWGSIEINACKEVLKLRKVLIPFFELDGISIENVPAYVSDTGFEFLVGIDTLNRLGLIFYTGKLRIEC